MKESILNLSGKKFGRLTAIEFAFKSKYREFWKFVCECGKTKIIYLYDVKRGKTKSCGCNRVIRMMENKLARKDLTNKKFGRLLVLKEVDTPENKKKKNLYWLCLCDCGNKKVICSKYLMTNNVLSCGCLQKENKTKHGMCGSSIYKKWIRMLGRCRNKNNFKYKDYGGRGVNVCEDWHKFENFYRDMGECPVGLSIDRIDNNGDYCKENCRWASMKEQNRNKRKTIFITYNGETKCLGEWAEIKGIKYITLFKRIKRNWTTEKIFDKVKNNKKNRFEDSIS